jgi:hypothetical protein
LILCARALAATKAAPAANARVRALTTVIAELVLILFIWVGVFLS